MKELSSRFYDEFGYGFNFDGKAEILHLGAAMHVGIIDESRLRFDLDWKEFSFIPSNADYVVKENQAFKMDYIKKVYSLFKPTKYAFYTYEKQEVNDTFRDITVLFLKREVVIAISPHLYPDKIEGSVCDIDEIFGEPASSVMVI